MKLLLATFVTLLSFSAGATKTETATLDIQQARVFEPMKGTTTTAGFGVLTNKDSKPIQISVESAEGFKAIELHESFTKDGVAGMKKIDNLTIEPSKSVELKPGSHHLMLFDATKNFKAGDKVKVTLKVGAKSMTQVFEVVSRIPKKTEEHHHH